MDSLVEGLCLVTLTGFFWALVGAVFSYVSRQNIEFVAFMFISSLFSAIGAWIFLFQPNNLAGDGGGICLNMVVVMALTGVISISGGIFLLAL